MDINEGFELYFIEAVVKKVEESGTSHRLFGEAIFGTDSGARLWSRMRKPGKNETRRSMRLEEAARIASYFGKELPTFIWEVYQEKKHDEEAQ